jgi:hypothetical protein
MDVIYELTLGGHDWNHRPVHAGRIRRWFRHEGDLVQYGDELCDVLIEEVKDPEGLWELREQIKQYSGPTAIAEMAARQLEGEELNMAEVNPESLRIVWLWPNKFDLRIASAQSGVLRKICAQEGERREAGQLLALLTTDSNELVVGVDERSVPPFRVVESWVWREGSSGATPGDSPR